MPKVVGIRLRYASKNYWFDPSFVNPNVGDHVIVESIRGRDIALVAEGVREVADSELKAPLKRVIRLADSRDFERAERLRERSKEAMNVYKDLVKKNELDMKPVVVDFAFSGDYATFYFSADERVDFRQLVRDLASVFHVRIDMRQVGVRDESRMLGGLGICGEELCCARMASEVQPVSIRMAKEQDLPLNPTKISGQCGRLMCCLRYEFEAYKDFKGRAPKRNALVDTPLGLAKVVDYDTPREIVNVLLEDGQRLSIPLSEMQACPKKKAKHEGGAVCKVSQESLDTIVQELNSNRALSLMGGRQFSHDEKLEDQVLDKPTVVHAPRKSKARTRCKSRPNLASDQLKRAGMITDNKYEQNNRQARKAGKLGKKTSGRNLRKRRSVSLETPSVSREYKISSKTSNGIRFEEVSQKRNNANNAHADYRNSQNAPNRKRQKRSKKRGGNSRGGGRNNDANSWDNTYQSGAANRANTNSKNRGAANNSANSKSAINNSSKNNATNNNRSNKGRSNNGRLNNSSSNNGRKSGRVRNNQTSANVQNKKQKQTRTQNARPRPGQHSSSLSRG